MKKKPTGKTKEEWEAHEAYQSDLANFRHWWEPFSTDPKTGASVGGQPDALRWWARPINGRWERRRYGEIAERAFKAEWYNKCWQNWKERGEQHGEWVQFLDQEDDGKVKCEVYDEPFVSNCLPLEEQQRRLKEIYATVGEKRWVEKVLTPDGPPNMTPIVTMYDEHGKPLPQ